MVKIIAIWGGEIREKTTIDIDKEIIWFSGKKNPKILFIPTASSDSEWYFSSIKENFESIWWIVDVLYLIKENLSIKEISEKILSSDIIYVGGGNTLKMMTLWRKLWVDKILDQALQKDIVLCWLSSGSMCWFTYGQSDSRKWIHNDQFIKVTWLGYISALHCPHYNSEIYRDEDLKRMMRKTTWVAIALEDNCAIQIQNDTYRIITSNENAKAYRIYCKQGKYYKEQLQKTQKFLSLEKVLKK